MFRLVPVVMALTIALCPVALDVCQVACAEDTRGTVVTSASAGHDHHAEPADAMSAHHHGHHAAPVTTGPASRVPADTRIAALAVRSVPHSCVHGEGLPALVGTNLQIALPPAAGIQSLFELPELTSGRRPFTDAVFVIRSPQPILTTQLRV